MNILILQIDIGHGTQWGDLNTPNIIREHCIPSVKKYAAKHNYDYELITNSTYLEKIGPLDFLETENKHFSFERYLRLNSSYDAVAYIDNDVYVNKNANPLPDIDCLMASAEPEKTNSQEIFSRLNKLSADTLYFNSGVFFADNSSAKRICAYMTDRAKRKIRAKGKSTDNMMFNEYVYQENPSFQILPESWNYMPMLPGATKGLNANFLHLVGGHGKNLLKQLSNLQYPMEQLLDSIVSGQLEIEL